MYHDEIAINQLWRTYNLFVYRLKSLVDKVNHGTWLVTKIVIHSRLRINGYSGRNLWCKQTLLRIHYRRCLFHLATRSQGRIDNNGAGGAAGSTPNLGSFTLLFCSRFGDGGWGRCTRNET